MSSTNKLFIPNEVLDSIVCLFCGNYLSIFPVYTKNDSSGGLCGRCKVIEEDKFIRDEAYEGIAQFLLFPCRYSKNGCNDCLTPSTLEEHEPTCKFRKFDCPNKNYSKCKWSGARANLVEHYQTQHPTLLLKERSFNMNFKSSQEENFLLPHGEELFIIKKEVDARKGIFTCTVEHVKATEESNNFNYFLKIESEDKNYFYKCPEKDTSNNDKLNSTLLTKDVLNERLQDPDSMIVNIFITTRSLHTEDTKPEEAAKDAEVHKNPNINWDILSELECPICFEYMLPNIFQCINGHSICSICKPKLNGICPTCKDTVKDSRNIVLEKMTQHMVYPCKFYKNGCQYSCKTTEIQKHENSCNFGPYECPLKSINNCTWMGSHPDVTGHVENNHKDGILKSDKVDVDFKYNETIEKIFLINFQKKVFKLIFKFQNEKFYWSLQYVGPSSHNNQYKFEIDVTDLSGCKKRCFFSGVVGALCPKEEYFTKRGEYIVACLEQLETFITDAFSFRVRIIQE